MGACIPRNEPVQLRLPFDEDAEVWNHFVHNTYGIVKEAWNSPFEVLEYNRHANTIRFREVTMMGVKFGES